MSFYKLLVLISLGILSLALCIEQQINYGTFFEIADILHHEVPAVIFIVLLGVFVAEWLYSGDP